MGYKSYPFSRRTYYRRKRRAKKLGLGILDLPDGRGKHSNHVSSKDHYRWNDAQIISNGGYTKTRVGVSHPLADSNGYALEHILIWLSAGRTLDADTVLHHINSLHNKNRSRDKLGRFVREQNEYQEVAK